ncbi:MAG: hypothetical protein WBY88_13525 [Desulfosarcina sp.]
MMIWLYGYAGIGIGLADGTSGYDLVNPHTATLPVGEHSFGVRLTLSPRSSLTIDVEGILDYVKGDFFVDPSDVQSRIDVLNPWVNWNISF